MVPGPDSLKKSKNDVVLGFYVFYIIFENQKMENPRKFGFLRSASQGLHPRPNGAACSDGHTCHPMGGAVEARRPGDERATKVERLEPDDDCSGLTQATPRGAGPPPLAGPPPWGLGSHSARTAHEQRTNSARTAHEQRTKEKDSKSR